MRPTGRHYGMMKQSAVTFDLFGQTAVVSGGTRGIGAAVSRALLRAGATVVATYATNREQAEAFCTSVGDEAERLRVVSFDVADYAECERFFATFDERHERLDILVCNAGIRRDAVVALMPEDDWRRVLDVNLSGTFHLCKLAVQRMVTNRYGRILCITSPSERIGFPGQGNYAASKAGQVALVKSLAKEVARRGITVNAVSPGFTETDLIADLPAEQAKAYRTQVPLRRFAKPEEVAYAVCSLAAPEAAYITGAVLEVSGGL